MLLQLMFKDEQGKTDGCLTCICLDEMFNTWRYVFIDNSISDYYIDRAQFPNLIFAIKELLKIPNLFAVKEIEDMDNFNEEFLPVKDFVDKYYNGKEI